MTGASGGKIKVQLVEIKGLRGKGGGLPMSHVEFKKCQWQCPMPLSLIFLHIKIKKWACPGTRAASGPT